MKIIDGARHFGRPGHAGEWISADVEQVVRHKDSPHSRLAARMGVSIPALTPSAVAESMPVVARLEQNRWIADCPDCNGAEFAYLDRPFFWCANCHNVMAGHKWRPIVLPKNRTSIEQIVLARPMPQNRNWRPGETLTAMRAENRDHGLPERGD